MEAFLTGFLPRLLGNDTSFAIHVHQGKSDLLGKLPSRLRGYSRWLPDDFRIIVIVDRDDDDCLQLKQELEMVAKDAKLSTRATCEGVHWQLVNRIAVEELEAWYFGDWSSVRLVFPKLAPTIPQQAPFRDPDAIAGGTWEAFERVCKKAGYFSGGLRKLEAATALGNGLKVGETASKSFRALTRSIREVAEIG